MNVNVSNEGRAADVPPRTAEVTTPSRNPKAPARARSAVWLMAGLLIVSGCPLIFGVLRLIQLAGGAEIMPARARFDASPLPVVVHIVSAAVYSLVGAFQFATRFRQRYPAGTAWAGGSWLSAAYWLGCQVCG